MKGVSFDKKIVLPIYLPVSNTTPWKGELSGSTDHQILYLGAKEVRFMLQPSYLWRINQLDMRLSGPKNRSGHSGEKQAIIGAAGN
jgi:hypothetical protein